MSEETVFSRFLFELRTLLTAIESHVVSLGVETPEERRPQALREMARLANATAALTRAFEVEDMRVVAEALAQAASDAAEASATDLFAPIGAHDALTYMRWRAEAFADHGQASPPDERDWRLARRLEQALRGPAPDAAPSAPATTTAPPEEYPFAPSSELTLADLALLQSFPSAPLRPRDADADARQVARVASAPIFTARTESGDDVPVYGGVAQASDDDLDELPPELRRVFTRESAVEVRALGKLMLEFEQRPDDTETLASMAFIAHKLKGAASTMAFSGFARIADAFEATAKTRQSRRATTDSVFLAGLARFLDLFERALAAAEDLEEPTPALIEEAEALRDELTRGQGASSLASDTSQVNALTPAGQGASAVRRRPSDDDLVLRVEARKLDTLMNQLSALAANRGAMTRNRDEIGHVQEEMRETLLRLREKSAQISDTHPLTFDNLFSARGGDASGGAALDSEPAAPATPSGALRASWSALEMERYTDIDSALRALAEVVADVSADYGVLTASLDRLSQLTETQEALTRDIQEVAMDMRLARMGEITPRARLAALVAAKNLGKLADFDARGDEIEIDRSVMEALEDPLIQLMRNAVAHGIEPPLERTEAGKPARGR
ncbi:MAG: Hpt domain-containing protein, partial [Chloroflexota bacterium]|nr:Hpt domain-containing protein [Chloroflexota bacterium]